MVASPNRVRRGITSGQSPGRAAIATTTPLAIAAIWIAACGPVPGLRHGPGELDHARLSPVSLKGHVLYASDQLSIPLDLTVVGEYLVIADYASDSVFHVVDRQTGTLLSRAGRRGAGPHEYKSVWSLDVMPGSTQEFYAYDVALRRLTLVDIGKGRGVGLTAKRMIHPSGGGTPTGPVSTLDATFLSFGFFPAGRIGVFDENGDYRMSLGELPGTDDKISPTVRQHIYQSTIAPHPERHLIAAVCRYSSRVEIHDMAGRAVAKTHGPLLVEPRYSIRNGSEGSTMETGKSLRFGYVDVTANADHILALFSGRTVEGFAKRANFGRYVHAFDWEGRFKRALKLDVDALTIAVDPESYWLYAVRHDPTPAIVRYSLEGLFESESETVH